MGAILKGTQAEGWGMPPSALLSLQVWQGSRRDSEPRFKTACERNQLAREREKTYCKGNIAARPHANVFKVPSWRET